MGVALLLAATSSCGPELTQPASANITGRWTSTDVIGPLSQLTMDVTQAANGTVQGQWAGTFYPPDAPCPPNLKPAASGAVDGANTVVELHLALLGAGDFDGQVPDDKTLSGSFVSCGIAYPFNFTRVVVAGQANN